MWWQLVPPLIAAIACLLLPGLAMAYLATLRGAAAWGLAPLLSGAGFTILLVVFGVLHVPWSAATVLPGLGVIVALVAAVRWGIQRARGPQHSVPTVGSDIGGMLVAASLAFVLVGVRCVVVFGDPAHIAQTFDTNFHLNAIRYILSTSDANPLTFTTLAYGTTGMGGFYPNLWHGVASVVVQFSGAAIPVAANAMTIAIAGMVWPLSAIFLVRVLCGPRRLPLLIAGVAASAFASFPLHLVSYGVLYPNLLSLAYVPAALAALAVGLGYAGPAGLPRPLAWLALASALPTLCLAQPNGLVSLLVVAAPLLVVTARRWLSESLREKQMGAFAWRGAVAMLVVAAMVATFVFVRPLQSAASWPPTLGPRRAAADALLNAQLGPAAVTVSVFVVAGAVAVFLQRRHRWLVASAVLLDVLYVATAYLPVGNLRYWVTGTWYSDVNRVIANGPIILVPLAVIGALAAARWLAALAMRLGVRGTPGRAVAGALTIVLGAALMVGSQAGVSLTVESRSAARNYAMTTRSVLLSPDELALLDRVASETPADAVIAGNPWTGTALVWAIADRRALMPQIYGAITPDIQTVLLSLRYAGERPGVCEAIQATHVGYVLDFGDRGVFGPTKQFPGVTDLAGSRAVTLVDRVGNARLYRVTGCP